MKEDKHNQVNLPKEAIIEFQELYLVHFGIEISLKKAETEALNLLELFRLVQTQ